MKTFKMDNFYASKTAAAQKNAFFSYRKLLTRSVYLVIMLLLQLLPVDSVTAQNTLDRIGLTAATPASVAYSVRKLSTSYGGNAIMVRRSSDNATQAIGFTASGDLDETALLVFVGSGSGYITTWYDQSGNGVNAVQATAANQPRIVNAGALEVNGAKPALWFNGVAQNLVAAVPGISYPNTYSLLANTSGATIKGAFFKYGAGTTGIGLGAGSTTGNIFDNLGTNVAILKENRAWCYTTGPVVNYPTTHFISTTIQPAGTTALTQFLNGVDVPMVNATTSANTSSGTLYLGGYAARFSLVKESEMILFPSALSTSTRGTLECNQATYYQVSTIQDVAAATCSNVPFTAVPSAPAGTTYSWSAPVISPAGALTGGSAATSQPSISQTLANTTSANATATYTVTPTGCGTGTFQVTVNVSPGIPVITGSITGNNPACRNATGLVYSITAASNAQSYAWTFPANWTITAGGTTNSVTVTTTATAAAGNISVTATNGCGTTAPTTIAVTTNPLPATYALSAQSSLICVGSGTNIFVAGSETGVTYQLRTGTTNLGAAVAGTGSGLTLPTGNITVNTAFNVLATNNTTGCFIQISGPTVNVQGPVNRTVAPSTISLCYNTGTSITVATSTLGIDYQLRNNADNSSIGAPIAGTGGTITFTVPALTASTTYNVLGSSSANGCQLQMSITPVVTVYPDLTLTGAVQSAAVCDGSGAVINLSGLVYPGTYTVAYSINGVAQTPVTGRVADIAGNSTFTTASVFTANNGQIVQVTSLTRTSQTPACTKAFAVDATLTINPKQTLSTVEQVGIACVGSGATIKLTGLLPNTTSSIGYKINNGTTIYLSSVVADASGEGVFVTGFIMAIGNNGQSFQVVSATITSSTPNCPYTLPAAIFAPANLVVHALPTLTSASLASAVCAGSGAVINIGGLVASGSTSTINYTIGGVPQTPVTNVVATGATGSFTTAPLTIANNGQTLQITSITRTDLGSTCTTPLARNVSLSVTANATGSLVATETSGLTADDGVICAGATVTFTATSGYNNYRFYKNGSIVQNVGPAHTWSSSSLVNGDVITVEVFNALNCATFFNSVTVTVQPLPTASLSADKTTICPGDTIHFTAAGGVNYVFKVNGVGVQSSASATYSNSTLNNSDVVTVDVSNANNCMATATPLTITVKAVPTGTLAMAPSTTICVGDTAHFTAPSGYSSYEFKVNGVTLQGPGALNTYNNNTLTNAAVVSVKIINSLTCAATLLPVVVTVNNLPTGSLIASENSNVPNDNTICSGETVIFSFNPGFSSYNFKVNGVSVQNNSSNTYTNTTLVTADVVTVEVTNASNCKATFTAPTISISAAPAGTLSAPAANCAGDDIGFTATAGFVNYNFKVNGSTVQNGSSNTYNSTILLNGDVVTVEVTNANTCTTIFNAITLVVNPLPTGTLVPVENSGLASNDGIICTGATVVFTAPAGFTNYDFIKNGVSVQNSASNTYSTSSLANNDEIEVVVTNSNSCIALLNKITVTINSLPTVAATTGVSSICVNGTTTVSNATAAGVWSSSNTGIATIDAAGLISGIAGGSVTINYTVTNANGCIAIASLAFTVNPLPVVPAITGTRNVCVGSTTTLSNTTAGGVWTSSDVTVATVTGSGVVSGVAAGTALIKYKVTNGNGCADSASTTITVNALPVLSPITGTVSVCVNLTTILSNTTAGGTWSSNNLPVATVNAGTGVVTGVSGGTALITYTYTNGNSCTSSVLATVTVNALPVPTLSGPNPICVGSTGNVYTTEAGQFNYTWVVTNGIVTSGGTSSDNTVTVSWTAPGAKNISVNYSDINGCTGATSATVLNAPSPALPVITGPSPVCEGYNGNVYSTQSGGGQNDYLWTVNGGTITAGGTATDPTVTITWTTPGARSVSVNFDDLNGCRPASPTVYPVTVNPVPTATIAGTASVCQNGTQPTITFTGAGSVAPYTFTYRINAGANQTVVSTGNIATVTVPTTTAGTFNYQLLGVQGSGSTMCAQIQTGIATVTVNPLPTAAISGSTTVCMNATSPFITFTGANGTAPYTFIYKINAGANQTVTTVSGNDVTVAVPTTAATTLTYTLVSVRDASSSTCLQLQSGTATVVVNPLPTATIGGTTQVCIGSAAPLVTFTAAGGTAPYTFTYNINSGGNTTVTTISGNSVTVAAPTGTAGTFTYNLVSVTDASVATCSNPQSGSAVITVNPLSVGGTVNTGASVCSGTNGGTLTLAGQTGTVVRWESSIDGGANWVTIANTTTSLSYTNITATTEYRAVVKSGDCAEANSAFATVIVNAVSVGGTVSSNAVVCAGTNSGSVTLAGYTGSVIRWEFSTNGGSTWTTIANTTTTQAYSNLTQTTAYRAVVQNSVCASANSAAATITVNARPTGSINGTQSICFGAPATLTLTVTGSGTISGTLSDGSSFSGTAPTITTSVTPGATTIYTIQSLSDANCASTAGDRTGSVTVTVNTLPSTPIISPVTANICLTNIQPLSAGPVTTNYSATFSSGTVNLNVPNNSATGVSNIVPVSGIPAGAVITSVNVNFNITHDYDGELRINLRAPNNNVLNLVNQKGGSGDNFTNTTVGSNETTIFTTDPLAAPFTGAFRADAVNNVTASTGVNSNVTAFTSLYAVPNGNWLLSLRDLGTASNVVGKLNDWTITINYSVTIPTLVNWTPQTDLYTDPAATIPYTGGDVSTVYAKPLTAGTKTYTATSTNPSSCSNSQTVTIDVNALPAVSISADYCVVPGKVRLTANSTPAASGYAWVTGETTQSIDVDIAAVYEVTVLIGSGCTAKANFSVAQELVVNGSFTDGNVAFISDYTYQADLAGVYELSLDTGRNGYGIGADGRNYHANFWGQDHTNNIVGPRNYMIINGHGSTLVLWKETVTVLPNTTYYFSGWGMSLNDRTPYGRLQFNVNGTQVGTVAALGVGVTNNSNNGWTRFYGNWTSGATVTNAVISITNLESSLGGNDFGIDDISFATLSTFVALESDSLTDAQKVCVNSTIKNIVYDIGNGNSSAPIITGLPAGISANFLGDKIIIGGTTTALPGLYAYSITTTGCNPVTISGTIEIKAPAITLTTGSNSPTICVNTAVNIGFTLGGTATGVNITGLPTGVTSAVSGNTVTISGTPTVAGNYTYSVTTTGDTCTQLLTSGIIHVQEQTITLSSAPATATQTVCLNVAITNIQYAIGGTGTGASVTGLPPGVSGNYSGGLFIISGSPTSGVGSPYNFTVTTSGPGCAQRTATGTITITPSAVIALSSAAGTNAQVVCRNVAIIPTTFTVTNATGAAITAGSLPAGVTGSFSGGVFTISGTPTVSGTFNYTITTSGGCGFATASGTLTAQVQTIGLTSGSASPSLCINTGMTNIVYTLGGAATSATVVGLPTGVNMTVSGTQVILSGTPTASGSYPFTISTTGTCAAATASGTITVQATAVGGMIASVNVCSGSSGSLNLLGQMGTIVRWEVSVNGGSTWSPIVNTNIAQSYTNVLTTTQYRAVLNNGCGIVYSTVATIGIHNLWTGAISSDWQVAGNWSDNALPTLSCPDVIIPAGTPNPAILSTGLSTINNLVIKPSASVVITSTLKIGGSITNGGSLDVTNGTLDFVGTATQNISGNMFAANMLKNLTVSNTTGLTVASGAGNTLSISGVLAFGNVNNSTFNTGDNIILTSTASNTARVADITNNSVNSGNNITGKATVQRYYPARRAWRLITAPLSGSGSIYSQWQNNGVYQVGAGMLVTGATPNAINGLDPSPLNNPSLKGGSSLTNIGDTKNTNLSTGNSGHAENKAFFCFVRGDRNPQNTNTSFVNTTTISSFGNLQTGPQSFNASAIAQSYTLVGNPYMSPIDLQKATLNNLYRRFYVWDPYLNQQGGYIVMEDLLNNGTYTNTPSSPGGQDKEIQSSQAIFVQTSAIGGPASIVFNETNKTSLSNPGIFRPAAQPGGIRVNLMLKNADNSLTLADGTYAEFDDRYSKAVMIEDALKFINLNENLSFQRNNQGLAVERIPAISGDDTLFLKLTKTTRRHYSFEVEPINFDASLTAFLEDGFLGTKTPLNTTGNTMYDFSVTTATASAAADRFRIVFQLVKALPVTYRTVKAYKSGANIAVEWTVDNEINIAKYEVEKSTDGRTFAKVGTTPATGSNRATTTYNWLDLQPVSGNNFYRIRSIGTNGLVEYSNVVVVKIEKANGSISVYPNPVKNGIVNLQFANMPQGVYTARLVNNLGQVLYNKTIAHTAASVATTKIETATRLLPGIYQLEVIGSDKTSTIIKVIVE